MIIQIYEIQTPDEARQMVELGVDHVGSVLVSSQGLRNTLLESVIRQVQRSGRKSSLIPLFTQTESITNAVRYYRPDILHFCEILPTGAGAEEALHSILERQSAIRNEFPGLEIMRSIPIGGFGCADRVPSLELAAMFEPVSDWFLTDTLICGAGENSEVPQPVHGYVGITGRTCDWNIARQLVRQSRIPVILAGGIGPDNVGDGIAEVLPAGVDSCTLTNQVDSLGRNVRFKKDFEKVKALITAARQNNTVIN